MIGANDGAARLAWSYTRAERVADCVVHAIGVGLGVIGALSLIIRTATTT